MRTLFQKMLALPFLAAVTLVSKAETPTSPRYTEVVQQISNELDRAARLQAEGKTRQAQSAVADAYFDIFEGSGMEVAVGVQSGSMKADLEAQFNQIREMASSSGQHTALLDKNTQLINQLKAVAFQLDQGTKNKTQVFLSSFLILFREGFEAILIMGAIVAYLLKTNNRKHLGIVSSSVWTAIGASVATAVLLSWVLKVGAAEQELIEGITMLVACGVLFTVGHWLISQAETAKWQNYIRTHLQDSLSNKSLKTLWFTCFLAVYREGAEIVLFYQALWADAGKTQSTPILGGMLAATLALIVVYFLFKLGALRIPLKPFFRITSSLLYLLAFIFAGRAVVELQAGGYLKVYELEGWPTIGILGIYPSIPSLALQALLLIAFSGSLIRIFLKKRGIKLQKQEVVLS